MSENFKKEDGIYISDISGISMEQFIQCRNRLCLSQHKTGCKECVLLINVADEILSSGVCELSKLYRKYFSSSYRSSNAIRRLMQLPVVIFKLNAKPGTQKLYVVENMFGIDFKKIVQLANKFTLETKLETEGVGKKILRDLCKLASTEADRKLLKFAVCQASMYSRKKARKQLGIQNVNKLKEEVTSAIAEAEEIRKEVLDLASIKEKSALRCLGLYSLSDSDSSDSDGNSESDSEITEEENIAIEERAEDTNKKQQSIIPNPAQLLVLLKENKLNWFAFVEELNLLMRECTEEGIDVVNQVLVDFSQTIPSMNLDDDERERVEISRQAYLNSEKVARVNDTGLTDSESDDPEDWLDFKLNSEKGKDILLKQRAIIKRMAKRHQAKIIAERCLLKRKVSKRVSSILKKFPNIGKDIEEFVSNKRCGADAWRRTGVTTFDGNRKRGPKASFRSIQRYLEDKYSEKLGYGTIVQMCVVRNKRKLSAKRYKGVARVTCRRTRKGFNIKFNPDAHYSSTMYKVLDKVQLSNGSDKTVLNRDDQAGFRLDTTYTHSQHKVLSMEDQEVTTRTDFVNKYSSVLQTSTYLFMETVTNEEMAAGIVKNHFSFEKNPSQHAADFKFLKTTPEFKDFFSGKTVECIRVDGATDERPSILEVQFLWTEVHLAEEKVCTCVTARNSGSSFLNRVELVNGCIARAHSNVFIPSTLNGSNLSPDGLDKEKLTENLDAAADVYLDRVQGAPFGNTTITFFKGASNEHAKYLQQRRSNLIIFLHGSKKAKEALKLKNQVQYQYFEEVWQVRNDHFVEGYPEQYVFLLHLCYLPKCIHPLCKKGKPLVVPKWYDCGPKLKCLPMPVKDPSRPWGGECNDCKGTCAGHYMKADDCIANVMENSTTNCLMEPPSLVLKRHFSRVVEKGDISKVSEDFILECAKETLLTQEEVRLWFSHLFEIHERRKAGALKAAATRAKKKGKLDCFGLRV